MIVAILKVPVFVLIWALFLSLKILVLIVGLVAVALLWKWRDVDYDKLPTWTKPWANPNDWRNGVHGFEVSLPPWWIKQHGFDFRSFYHYHALRNPANGLRSYEWLDLDIDTLLVQYVGDLSMTDYEPDTVRLADKRSMWYLCWQGWQAGYKYVRIWNAERHLVIKLGWRIEPKDAHSQPPAYRGEDSGFATKVLFYRKG